jgi:peptidoglycan-N-acetylglucosamine deacetylase
MPRSTASLKLIGTNVRCWARDIARGPSLVAGSDPNQVALTFDDGPNDPCTLELLEVLHRANVRATFFLVGKFVRRSPEIVRTIAQAGHLIGNHTMNHPSLLWERPTRIRQQLIDCNHAIEDAAGLQVNYFRPPFGHRWRHVVLAGKEVGLTSVMWNVTGFDWLADSPRNLVTRMNAGIDANRCDGKGSNILLHDGDFQKFGADRSATVVAVAELLELLPPRGIRAVTVDQFLPQATDNRKQAAKHVA